MASYQPPKKNTAWIGYFDLVSQADTKLFQVNPTIAAGDFKVSIDGGAFANLATLPVVTPAGGRAVKISLSAGEMNGDNIKVQCVDAAGAEWCDMGFTLQTSTKQVDDLATAAEILTTALTESYAADGAAPTLAQFQFMLLSVFAEFAIAGVTITTKKLDGSTTAMTYTLNDATNPTSRTRAT